MTVAPAPAVSIRTDTSPDGLRTAIHDDFVASAMRRRTVPGEEVIETDGLLAYRSDIRSPDVNEIVRARFPDGPAADDAIDRALALFDGRPGFWWLDEDDTPADLSARLVARGVPFVVDIPGMAMELTAASLGDEQRRPAGLEIRPVLDPAASADFHEVLVQGFPEDFADDGVMDAMAAAAARVAAESNYREPGGLPTRWIGASDGRPVTTTRLHTAAGVAGIYAVVTAADARRRGYGEAITRHVLRAARDAGFRIATLQSSPEGRGVYERIGFRELRRYRLHEWQPAAGRAQAGAG